MRDGGDVESWPVSDFEIRTRVKRVLAAPEPYSGHLSGVRFDAPLAGVNFQGAVFEDVDFSGLHVDRFHISGSTFDRCDFSGSVLRMGSFSVPPQSVYRDCRFDGADLRRCNPGVTRFERCSFDKARIDGWDCTHNDFIDCRFAGRLRGVLFSGGVRDDPVVREGDSERLKALKRLNASRRPNEFHGNDFRDAVFDGVEFLGGIDLDAQVLPDDPEFVRFDIRPETLARVESFALRLPPDEQERALKLLGWLQVRYRHQPEALTNSLGEHTFGLYRDLLRQMPN
jgi:uncharacterized protein YjbI with pentapeptide repeats